MNRRAAFQVVDHFEQALCEFTGAPYAVAVDSCTNAIFLALKWLRTVNRSITEVEMPKHTYVGVLQAAKNAGYRVQFNEFEWREAYPIYPFRSPELWDCAKYFKRDMYRSGGGDRFHCVSFQAAKLLPIGRGGAILHDNPEADEWLRKARFDGRTEGASYTDASYQTPGYHMYLDPPSAARGLWLLTYLEDNDKGTWEEYPDLSVATWN